MVWIGLADEVGGRPRFVFGQAKLFFAELDAFDEEGHIACELAHSLEAFCILCGFTWGAAMHAVPILRGGDGHIGDGEVFIEGIEGGGCPATACNGNCRADLHTLIEGCRIEKTVKERDERAGGRGVVDGRADNKAIGGGKLLIDLIHQIIKDAGALFFTLATGDATMNGLMSHVDEVRFDAFLCECLGDFIQGDEGIASWFWTAVNEEDFHGLQDCED